MNECLQNEVLHYNASDGFNDNYPYPYSFILYAITSMPLHLIEPIKQGNLYS